MVVAILTAVLSVAWAQNIFVTDGMATAVSRYDTTFRMEYPSCLKRSGVAGGEFTEEVRLVPGENCPAEMGRGWIITENTWVTMMYGMAPDFPGTPVNVKLPNGMHLSRNRDRWLVKLDCAAMRRIIVFSGKISVGRADGGAPKLVLDFLQNVRCKMK